MRRCEWCKDGIPMRDENGAAYIVCALLPPTAFSLPEKPLLWVRPSMSLKGWCGQFRFSVLRFFGYGARA